jgi:hypothetical protein
MSFKQALKVLGVPALMGGVGGSLLSFVLRLLPLRAALPIAVVICIGVAVYLIRLHRRFMRIEADNALRMASIDRMVIEHLADLKRMSK